MQRNNKIEFPKSLQEWVLLDQNINTNNEITLEEDFEYDIASFNYEDLDRIPIFPEKKTFKKLDQEHKAVLREYVRRETADYIATYGKSPNENELIEIRKQMIRLFEKEYNITLKSDPLLRQFFGDNAAAVIGKLEKEMEDNK